MFKAVNNLKTRKGFTLIELLIVIAIIGILAAIAIPAFLGQREKAKQRSLESTCRGMVTEYQAAFDDFVSKTAMVFLTNPSTQTCYEWQSAPASRKCSTLYASLNSTTYGDDFKDIMTAVMVHHNTGKEEKSPYDGSFILNISIGGAYDPTFKKHVVITNAASGGDTSGSLLAYTDTGIIICNIPVSAR